MLLKREHWKPAEKQFVMDNIGKLSPHEMARHLRKTEKAVEQYIHRNRIIVNEKVNRNVVKEILTIKFKDPGYFNPTRAFYDAVGISQKDGGRYTRDSNRSTRMNIPGWYRILTSP